LVGPIHQFLDGHTLVDSNCYQNYSVIVRG